MQNRYVCDIGDFAKYSLLSALAQNELRLGVVWYLNPFEEVNSDGGFIDYPELRDCNERLYDRLHGLLRNGDRSLSAVEKGGILPPNTQYFSRPLPSGLQREGWQEEATRAVAGADIVFLDPDNGLPESDTAWRRAPQKYVSLEELVSLWRDGQTLVLYQHQNRNGTHEVQLERHCTTLRDFGAEEVWALTFHRRSVRGFLVVPAKRHVALLRERCTRFIQSAWGTRGHFRFRIHKPGIAHAGTSSLPPAAKVTASSPAKSRKTTDPGYTNRNGQTVIRGTSLPGTDHLQRVYVLKCGSCGREYGANGSDIFQRLCPWCQAGRPGLPIR